MATIYCTRLNIEAVIGSQGVVTCIDDNHNGSEETNESLLVAAAIEQAAAEMNRCLGAQYKLTDLAGNAWCKWCNTYLAIFRLQSRRNNTPSPAIVEQVLSYREILSEIRWGREHVPEQAPSFDHTPAVSNFNVEPNNPENVIVVDKDNSTGANPVGSRKRVTSIINRW